MEQSNNLFELQVDHRTAAFLREIAKWAKFMAIVGFVMMGFILLVVVFAGSSIATALSTSSAYGDAGTVALASMFSGTMMFVTVLMLLLYFFPTYYLFKFATKMLVALNSNEQETLNLSFENLKSCFKFIGILMIIVLSFYALGIIIAVLGYLSMA